MKVRIPNLALRWALPALLLLALPLAAQQTHFGQPIYPAYQGFVPNEDGSFVMVFQYFSHGRDPVVVPIGEANHFNGEADRNQPTTFLPGNHEFVCVMIVNNVEEAEALRWTVGFPDPGKPSSTSSRTMHYEFRLEQRSQENAMRDLDVANAPRGVCLNKPPEITIGRPRFGGPPGESRNTLKVTVGKDAVVAAEVTDEGLPRGNEVTVAWKVLSGPTTDVTLTTPTEASTHATFPQAGTYVLEIKASDGELERTAQLTVEAAAESAEGEN